MTPKEPTSTADRGLVRDACPCGAGLTRGACCGPYLDGAVDAPTALALMRARYSAYVEARVDFLARTLAPGEREGFDAAEVRRFSSRATWLGLTVLETSAGGPEDQRGTVTFEARYEEGSQQQGFRERSRFERLAGQWCYVDGDTTPLRAQTVRRTGARVGRNARCPCGSGRKFKRCCGA